MKDKAIGSDIIFAPRRGQSQKPTEIYELIEELVPNGRYLEIFARKNNLRWDMGLRCNGYGHGSAPGRHEGVRGARHDSVREIRRRGAAIDTLKARTIVSSSIKYKPKTHGAASLA